ncbi:MAG: UMP kinase, partial [Parcubacteria group bacterium]
MSKQKRVLLKISGETMSGVNKSGFDGEALKFLAEEINEAVSTGTEIAIVMGSGNLIRGSRLVSELGVTPVVGDHAGMLTTVINAIVLQDFLEHTYNIDTRTASAVEVNTIAEPYRRRRVMRHLEKKRVVVLAGGTGNPRFTTDSAAVLRAIEIEADMIIKGTKVDGIYNKDPKEHEDAEFIKRINHHDFVDQELHVLDSTAVTLAGENNMDIRVFNILEKGNLKKNIIRRG